MKMTGLEETLSLLDETRLNQAMGAPLDDAVANLLSQYRQYPPGKGNYTRTYDLQRGWSGEKTADPFGFVLINTQDYSEHVVGDDDGNDQAWMHVGRWYVAYQRAQEMVPQIIAQIEDSIRRTIGG